MTEEKAWPQNSRRPHSGYLERAHTKLSRFENIEDSVEKAVSALDGGRAVYLGMRVTQSMGNCDATMRPDSAGTKGGHAIAIVGYGLDESIPGGGYFMIKNSWGADCGDQGYQYMPFNYCTRSDMYCIMWDIKGVRSDFPGNGFHSELGEFNPSKAIFNVHSSKKWYQSKKRVSINIEADTAFMEQFEAVKIHGLFKGTVIRHFDDRIMKVSWKAKNRSYEKNVRVEYVMKNGDVFEQNMNLDY